MKYLVLHLTIAYNINMLKYVFDKISVLHKLVKYKTLIFNKNN